MELRVRVPLEKEVPVAAVVAEPEPEAEEQEFPELTEVKNKLFRTFGELSNHHITEYLVLCFMPFYIKQGSQVQIR